MFWLVQFFFFKDSSILLPYSILPSHVPPWKEIVLLLFFLYSHYNHHLLQPYILRGPSTPLTILLASLVNSHLLWKFSLFNDSFFLFLHFEFPSIKLLFYNPVTPSRQLFTHLLYHLFNKCEIPLNSMCQVAVRLTTMTTTTKLVSKEDSYFHKLTEKSIRNYNVGCQMQWSRSEC